MRERPAHPEMMQMVSSYCLGALAIDDLKINKDNFHDFLYAIKCHDLKTRNKAEVKHYKQSTYALRSKCLEASAGSMMTFEAYTWSINPEDFSSPYSAKSRAYASDITNYLAERQGLHAKITMGHVAEMAAMSDRFDSPEPILFALGGNTAVGKSFMAKNDMDFKKGIDDHGDASGALNPDTIKARLRFGQNHISNQQIHVEGYSLASKISAELHAKAIKSTMVVDRRLGDSNEINELIQLANHSGKKIIYKDIDAPLLLSCLRVLCRDIKKEPAVSFDVLASGYINMRGQRQNILDIVRQNATIKHYQLYVTDTEGHAALAAEKNQGVWQVIDQRLYDLALAGASQASQEVDDLKSLVLTPAVYQRYLTMGISQDQLQQYSGLSMVEAMTRHSMSLPQWEGMERLLGRRHGATDPI